jgi:hypothetical protein
MHGGPSQIETFDPKMSAPAEIRSATGAVATRLPGVPFGGTFPKLARLADRLAVVRSFTTGDANHDIKPVVSRDTAGATWGRFTPTSERLRHRRGVRAARPGGRLGSGRRAPRSCTTAHPVSPS